MDIAMLVLTAIGAACGIIAVLPIILSWVSHGSNARGAAQTAPSKTHWLLVLGLSILALTFSGVGLYRTFHYGDYKSWQSPKQETVYAKHYLNETVEVDGKLFDHCYFENVKFLYHGRGPITMIQPDFKGSIWMGSDNIAINQFMITTSFLDQNKGLFQLHRWVQMDSNGNPISVQ